MDKNYLRLRNSFNESELHLKDISICGAYSIDSECNYHSDSSELKYLYPAYLKTQTLDQPFDLNQDYDKIVLKLKEGSACLGNISKWLREHPEKAQTVDFVCFRGLLSSEIIKCLIENKIDWKIGAFRINDTIYLCSFDTEIKKEDMERQKLSPESVRSTNWGFKFEQFMLSEDPLVKPKGTGELNLNREFCVLFHAQLRNFKLLYGAEMDGVINASKLSASNLLDGLKESEFVELKTGKPFGLKMIKWWAQSYLVGINKIICGEKTENKINSLKQVNVDQILSGINFKGKRITENNICNLFVDVLQFIQDQVYSVDPGTYCLFEWNPSDRYKIRSYTTEDGQYKFLTQDFIDFMKSQPCGPPKVRTPTAGVSSLKRPYDDRGENREDGGNKSRRWDTNDGENVDRSPHLYESGGRNRRDQIQFLRGSESHDQIERGVDERYGADRHSEYNQNRGNLRQWSRGSDHAKGSRQSHDNQSRGNQRQWSRGSDQAEGSRQSHDNQSRGNQRQWSTGSDNAEGSRQSHDNQSRGNQRQWSTGSDNAEGSRQSHDNQSRGNPQQWSTGSDHAKGSRQSHDNQSRGNQRQWSTGSDNVEGSRQSHDNQSRGNQRQWSTGSDNAEGSRQSHDNQSRGNQRQWSTGSDHAKGSRQSHVNQSRGNQRQWSRGSDNVEGSRQSHDNQSRGNQRQWSTGSRQSHDYQNRRDWVNY